MAAIAKVHVISTERVERALDDLLVFDARCVDVPTRQALLRLLPQIVNLRRAYREHYQERGCLGCQKPDPIIAIAARLRQRGENWAAIYELVGMNRAVMSRAERKYFECAVRWKIVHPKAFEPKVSHRYGAGGFCDLCYARLRRSLAKRMRLLHQGRDAEKETAALTRELDVAQALLAGDGDTQS